MNTKRKLATILFGMLFILFIMSPILIFAATGDFIMDHRVVNGHSNGVTYDLPAGNKTVNLSAYYDYSTAPSDYSSIALNKELSVSVLKFDNNLIFDDWDSVADYDCSYSSGYFTLSKSRTYDKGTYAFQIQRAVEDLYYNSNNIAVGIVRIKGNVQFQ